MVGILIVGNDISKIEGLESLQDLRELVLDRNRIKSIDDQSFASQWNLQELHMEDNRLKDLGGLMHLENLKRLYLAMNRIQVIIFNLGDTCFNIDSKPLNHMSLVLNHKSSYLNRVT